LLAVMAASSMVGGLLYGARTRPGGVDRRFVWLAGLFAAAAVPLALATNAAQLGVLLAAVGLVYAPRMISAYLLLDELAPAAFLAEAYTWLVSATAGGTAIGSAIAGPIAEHAGPRWAFAAAGVMAVAGYGVLVARRDTLRVRGRSSAPRPARRG
jgi:MFS family permease